MDNHPEPLSPKQIHELVGKDNPLILEIGCHEGTDTLKFLEEMPGARIHCFEPDSRAADRFEAAFVDSIAVVLYRMAVGNIDGPAMFYASTGPAGNSEDWDYSGSLNTPTGHLTRSPEIKFKAPVTVPCTKLDSWLEKTEIFIAPAPGFAIDFAWVDIQGAQVKFIEGARDMLTHIRYLYIECHEKPLYEDEPTHDELTAMLPGFEPLGVYEKDNILFRNKAIA